MRREAREVAFSIIFARLFNPRDEFDGERIDELKKEDDRALCRAIVDAFDEQKDSLSQKIEGAVKGYEMGRVYKVDLALIYMALCEIIYVKTPPQVVINETLEMAKKFSTEKSAKFIHGVLSGLIKE